MSDITPETVRLWLAVPQGDLSKVDLARAYLIAAIEIDRLREQIAAVGETVTAALREEDECDHLAKIADRIKRIILGGTP